MPRIQRSALVPYAAEAMFELVDDVAAYPEFLPWCVEAHELERSAERVKARLVLARGGLRHSVTTENQRHYPERLDLHLLDGPFSRFDGVWRFQRLDEGASKVMLDLDFEYSGTLIRMALAPFFNKAADTLVDAFCQRARAVFGEARDG